MSSAASSRSRRASPTTFLKQRLFDPLRMKDTGFAIPAADPRMVPLYTVSRAGVSPGRRTRAVEQRELLLRLGGMVSTAEDYLQFAQMLVNAAS